MQFPDIKQFINLPKNSFQVLALVLLLSLSSCTTNRLLLISTQKVEQQESPLIAMLIKESDFGEGDKFSLNGSVVQLTPHSSENGATVLEKASFLASGDYWHKESEFFITVRHDIRLYEELHSNQLTTLASQFDENEMYRILLDEDDDYFANCTTQLYYDEAVQCEVVSIFGNLVSILNFTFPIDINDKSIKDIIKPVVESINHRIKDNFPY